jgi:hypothetical protein
MGEVERYRRVVRELIEEYGSYKPSVGDISVEVVIDEDKGHYEVMHSGWAGKNRVHGSVIHIDLVNDKVWIQYDGTSDAIANRLVEAGIPKDRIVLAFHSPKMREYTDFAVT